MGKSQTQHLQSSCLLLFAAAFGVLDITPPTEMNHDAIQWQIIYKQTGQYVCPQLGLFYSASEDFYVKLVLFSFLLHQIQQSFLLHWYITQWVFFYKKLNNLHEYKSHTDHILSFQLGNQINIIIKKKKELFFLVGLRNIESGQKVRFTFTLSYDSAVPQRQARHVFNILMP